MIEDRCGHETFEEACILLWGCAANVAEPYSQCRHETCLQSLASVGAAVYFRKVVPIVLVQAWELRRYAVVPDASRGQLQPRKRPSRMSNMRPGPTLDRIVSSGWIS